MIQINPPAKGRAVIIRLEMGKLVSIVQRRAKTRIVLLKYVKLLDASMLDMRDHLTVLWIAWRRLRQRRPNLADCTEYRRTFHRSDDQCHPI